MKFTILTLFPEYFDSFVKHSIIKNAINSQKLFIELVNIRDFSINNEVDDYVFGSSQGMLLKIEPIVKALEKYKTKQSKVFLLSPGGIVLDQNVSKKLSWEKHIILICGHYEGVDARIKKHIDGQISIGNYILTSGEIGASVIIDSVARLVDGVIKSESKNNESFETENQLIEHDQFTRPQVFRNQEVPSVLLSGDHKKILQYNLKNAYNNTIDFLIKNKK